MTCSTLGTCLAKTLLEDQFPKPNGYPKISRFLTFIKCQSHVLGSSLIKKRDQMSPLYNVLREQQVKFLARVWKIETSWALKRCP